MSIKNKKIIKYTLIITISILIVVGLIIGSIYLYKEKEKREYETKQSEIFENAVISFEDLYEDVDNEIPISDITLEQINKVEEDISKISLESEKYKIEKNKMSEYIERLKNYIVIRDDLYTYFKDDILNSDITSEIIEDLNTRYNELSLNFQELLKEKIDLMNTQFDNIVALKEAVTNLFTDENRTKVSTSATRTKYNSALEKLKLVVQEDIKEEEKKYLDIVEAEIKKREATEAERLKKEKEIAAAWKILNVPYISQNKNNVLNGCEVASLLMALQYKGYLKDMDLWTYAENVPKSTDPNLGFTYSIFEREPTNVPHWIAPAPLAQYGRDSSGANVVNITGSSIDDIDKEILAGNPVIIYLTSRMNNPTQVIEGAPVNLHVLLLTGYNTITGEHLIIDPWTQADGRTKWYVAKSKVESIFNSTGKRAVVVR